MRSDNQPSSVDEDAPQCPKPGAEGIAYLAPLVHQAPVGAVRHVGRFRSAGAEKFPAEVPGRLLSIESIGPSRSSSTAASSWAYDRRVLEVCWRWAISLTLVGLERCSVCSHFGASLPLWSIGTHVVLSEFNAVGTVATRHRRVYLWCDYGVMIIGSAA